MFLKASNHRNIECPANKTAHLQHILRKIFSFLKPKSVVGVSFCEFSKCTISECEISICLGHGLGHGKRYEDDDDEHIEGGYLESDLLFESGRCAAEGCSKRFCWRHFDEVSMSICDVCNNGNTAERNLGMHDGCAPALYCHDHTTRCTQNITEEGDGIQVYLDCSDSENEYCRYMVDLDDEDICGFMCCSYCINNHTCGDDPSEYC
jgi:hypothetical protein